MKKFLFFVNSINYWKFTKPKFTSFCNSMRLQVKRKIYYGCHI